MLLTSQKRDQRIHKIMIDQTKAIAESLKQFAILGAILLQKSDERSSPKKVKHALECKPSPVYRTDLSEPGLIKMI